MKNCIMYSTESLSKLHHLRSRKKDIPLIVGHLLVKLNQEFGMNIKKITDEAHWNGLSNMIGQEMYENLKMYLVEQ